MSGWGGSRAGAGAKPKTLLELLRSGSFVRVRHVTLLDRDRSLADVPADDPDAGRAAAAWLVQRAYIGRRGDIDLVLNVFGRLLRGRDGWEQWAAKAEMWFR